jgi:HD-GYP domain-containing protein (c-di-GMP phosphodiesterase class II)
MRGLTQRANTAQFLSDEIYGEVLRAGAMFAQGPGGPEPYFTKDEVTCLSVRRGTLTSEERELMQSHALMTRRLLSQMSFPKQYRHVPEWASGHHELLNGKGYPDGLSGSAIPTEARILTILDIYDALTAADRPYKPATPRDKAFGIMRDMVEQGQLDGRLLELFIRSEAWTDA